MLNSIKNPKSNIKHRLQSTIHHPPSKIQNPKSATPATRHLPQRLRRQSTFLQILSSCLKFIQNPKFKIQNFLIPPFPLLQSLRQPPVQDSLK